MYYMFNLFLVYYSKITSVTVWRWLGWIWRGREVFGLRLHWRGEGGGCRRCKYYCKCLRFLLLTFEYFLCWLFICTIVLSLSLNPPSPKHTDQARSNCHPSQHHAHPHTWNPRQRNLRYSPRPRAGHCRHVKFWNKNYFKKHSFFSDFLKVDFIFLF